MSQFKKPYELLKLSPVETILLSDIKGIHPYFQELTKDLNKEINPIKPKKIQQSLVFYNLELHPLVLHKTTKVVSVIGNLLGYYSARENLDPSAPIPVRFLEVRSGVQL